MYGLDSSIGRVGDSKSLCAGSSPAQGILEKNMSKTTYEEHLIEKEKSQERRRKNKQRLINEYGFDENYIQNVLHLNNSYLYKYALEQIEKIGKRQFVKERLEAIHESMIVLITNRKAQKYVKGLVGYFIETEIEKYK